MVDPTEKGRTMLWINHPAADGQPVSVLRWLAFQLSQWLYYRSRLLEHWALYGKTDDEIPF